MNEIISGRKKMTAPFLILILLLVGYTTVSAQKKAMMIRISEIEINPENLEEYKQILKEEAEASVRIEPGVICIFPVYERENPNQVRILEIYAGRKAYELHLKSAQFQKYKTTTLDMVKSLKLIEMETIDLALMPKIFKKMKKEKR